MIQLTIEDLKMCNDFADLVFSTNQDMYRRRNQSNPVKIKNQINIGKLCELAVHRFLAGSSEPDFGIYKKSKKSFDADLTYKGFKLHVKGQDSIAAASYGTSWVFTYSSSGGSLDPLLVKQTEEDLVAFVLIDMSTLVCDIKCIMKAKEIVNVMSLPRILSLYQSKRVVYLENLKGDLCLKSYLLSLP